MGTVRDSPLRKTASIINPSSPSFGKNHGGGWGNQGSLVILSQAMDQ